MNSIEEIRATIATTLKTIHDASHAAIPVMWPNFTTIDLENLTGPFVSVEIVWDYVALAGCGETDSLVKGRLLISFLRKSGDGLTGAASYADTLLQHICFKKLSGITYQELKVLSVSPYPGIVGQMNVIPFMV